MGFHPVAVVGRFVKNRKETAEKEKQYTKQYKNNTKHRLHKIENKNINQKANKKNLEGLMPRFGIYGLEI